MIDSYCESIVIRIDIESKVPDYFHWALEYFSIEFAITLLLVRFKISSIQYVDIVRVLDWDSCLLRVAVLNLPILLRDPLNFIDI